MHLVLYNFGIPKESFTAPGFEGFLLREAFNFEAASRAHGFRGRSGYKDEPGPDSWGEQVFPRFIRETGFEAGTSSLSRWRDIESLMAFSYSGVHADALKHARNWMGPRSWPPLVLWWVAEDEAVSWADAVRRLEYLHDHGPSAHAFHFKTPFGPDGEAYEIDRSLVRAIAARNAPAQADLMEAVGRLKI
ncbi:MAG TPA: DUF3291 domain-containing protein [Ensifer sp.]|nr:DUF3291 domain-containing protein [Ensifer sp.]